MFGARTAVWIRATLPGRLVLGQGFHALDLVCYVIGVALGVAVELAVLRLCRQVQNTGPVTQGKVG